MKLAAILLILGLWVARADAQHSAGAHGAMEFHGGGTGPQGPPGADGAATIPADLTALDVVLVSTTAGLTTAIAAASADTMIMGAPGSTFTLADTLDDRSKTSVVLWMYGCTIQTDGGAGWVNKPLVEMTGSQLCGIVGGHWIAGTSNTNKPACVLLMAREADSSSAGQNYIRDCFMTGYLNIGTVINQGSEANEFTNCQLFNFATVAGGATCLYLGSGGAFPATLDPLGAQPGFGSLLRQTFNNCTFSRFTTSDGSPHVVDDSVVVIDTTDARMGDLVFRDCGFGSGPGVTVGTVAGIEQSTGYPTAQSVTYKGVFRLTLDDVGPLFSGLYGLTMDNCRCETLGARAAFHVTAGGTASAIGINIHPNCTWLYAERFWDGALNLLVSCNIAVTRTSCSAKYSWGYVNGVGANNTASADRRRDLMDIKGAPDTVLDFSALAGIACQHDVATYGLPANRSDAVGGLYTAWTLFHLWDTDFAQYPSTTLRVVFPTDVMSGGTVENPGGQGVKLEGLGGTFGGGSPKFESGLLIGGDMGGAADITITSTGIATATGLLTVTGAIGSTAAAIAPTPGATTTVTITAADALTAAWTAGQTETVVISGAQHAGQQLTCVIANDATARTLTFTTGFAPSGPLTGTINKTATIHFVSNGTSFFEVGRNLLTDGSAATGWAATNVTPDRALDGVTYTVGEMNDVLTTLISDLKAKGVLNP